jgi:phosphohistidine phosphatase SixA
MRDRLRGESRDIMIAGHYPHLPALLAMLLGSTMRSFPQHGIVALVSEDEGATWTEEWRVEKG